MWWKMRKIHFASLRSFALIAASLSLAGCYTLAPSSGGGENVVFHAPRRVNAADVAVADGYEISVVASGLCFPTGICFDDSGGVYVVESGSTEVSEGSGNGRLSRLLKINPDGSTTSIASGDNSPWNGATFYKGNFYIAAGGDHGPGEILRISPKGEITKIVENLPSQGEFHVTGPVVGPDGFLYFGQGAATNSGVVGADDFVLGWPQRHRRFHDIPGGELALTGLNVQGRDEYAADPASAPPAITGAYEAFGEPAAPGEKLAAQVPCTGSIMRVPLAGGPPQLVAWGLRNPFGLAFTASGDLYATEQSYEARGSRPVSGCGDLLWKITEGKWYGWPDFYGDIPLTSSRQFAAVGKVPPQAILSQYPGTPPKPAAVLAMHAGAGGLAIATGNKFGFSGEIFVAESGDLAGWAGRLQAPTGFDVVRVDPVTGVSHVFAVNKGTVAGPASRLGTAGLERPIAVRFDPKGEALYVVDYGVVTVADRPRAEGDTGVVWRIGRKGTP